MIRSLPRIFLKLLLIVLCCCPLLTKSQDKLSCRDLRTGIFYAYPKNMEGRYFYTRDSLFQKEIEVIKGDTLVWKVKWLNSCTYSLKYVSGYKEEDKDQADFANKHIVIVKIKAITDNYYTYSAYIDEISDNPVVSDTLWLTEKVNFTTNKTFEMVSDGIVPGKKHFNDTSKYALVYVYRPGKLTNSASNYLVYFDDYVACVAKNKSGYIFKVFREGPLEIKSSLYKDQAAVKVDIKFGQKYFVRSMVHWTISSKLYNFKLEMKLMEPAEGETEFDEVKLQTYYGFNSPR